MALQRIKDFDPDYRNHFDDQDIVSFGFYSGDEKVGTVDDLLVDEEGRFRYLVLNTGAWILAKKSCCRSVRPALITTASGLR